MKKIRVTASTVYEAIPGSTGYEDCKTIEDCLALDKMEQESGKADVNMYLDDDCEVTFELVED